MARETIRKSVRFAVFKRDSFTCQYCGQKAPDVVLEIDHITPVARGGDNSLLNLVTACRPCNAGKSDKALSDSSAVEKARRQADDSQERLRQIQMIADWHASLIDIDTKAVERLESLWFQSVNAEEGTYLVEAARDEMRSVIKRYGFDVACQGVVQAAARYSRKSTSLDQDMARSEAFWSIAKICSVLKADRNDPGVARLFYIRGILRKRLQYMHEGACISLLKQAREYGVCIDWMEELSKSVSSWTQYRNAIDEVVRQIIEDEEATDGTHPQH
jgi:hypothetical protein